MAGCHGLQAVEEVTYSPASLSTARRCKGRLGIHVRAQQHGWPMTERHVDPEGELGYTELRGESPPVQGWDEADSQRNVNFVGVRRL